MKLNSFLLLILSGSGCFAQTAKDYFFPPAGKNLSVYKMIYPRGKDKDGWITKVYVREEGDSALITTQSNLASMRNDQVISGTGIWEQSVKINESEILAFGGKTSTSHGVECFNKGGEIIFKIPPGKSKKVEWENPDQKGSMIEAHVSEFSKIRVNGEKKKAVKVTTILKRKRSGKKENFYVDYYVEGIGRYKRTTPNNKITIEALTDQLVDINPPTVK
jgi:hypothetical protein